MNEVLEYCDIVIEYHLSMWDVGLTIRQVEGLFLALGRSQDLLLVTSQHKKHKKHPRYKEYKSK